MVGRKWGREGDKQRKQNEQRPCGWGDFSMIGGNCNGNSSFFMAHQNLLPILEESPTFCSNTCF